MALALATWSTLKLGNRHPKCILGRLPDPFGGNAVETTAELLFPLPFIEDRRSVRSAIFIDAVTFLIPTVGKSVNCFGLELGELRYSYGLGITWLSGFDR